MPPDPAHLMEHLHNWEKYYHEERPDPLVQLAIIHAQFEIIHPCAKAAAEERRYWLLQNS